MLAIEIHGTSDIFCYFLLYNYYKQLISEVECLWVILKWPAKN